MASINVISLTHLSVGKAQIKNINTKAYPS